ncbi:AsnC family transcriptional regulator [Maritimibacter sp. 55A14]|uniref:Lrp/AsnC family transcriptional regulator n=1 Tax=Maritimibacter sp. 55A14 TaxID=2174844 RepID=UPI000D604B57|nr:Lrp/AsnC family transcriptional regulator [Maritimibacter sp. 55A14]PWE33186.1 AsnC family transcriptional regulator [Maritimibacter sp. 55A14]
MDRLNTKILSELQRDSNTSLAILSERIGLSLSACHRRIKALETEGVIRGYSARLDRARMGLEMQVFIEVKLVSQRSSDLSAFEGAVAAMPEVLECHMISGDFDYIMRVAARNTAGYEQLYRQRLSQLPSVSQMRTLMSLSTVKEFSGFHLDGLD